MCFLNKAGRNRFFYFVMFCYTGRNKIDSAMGLGLKILFF